MTEVVWSVVVGLVLLLAGVVWVIWQILVDF
jgi:hypothetical protein